MTLKLNSTLCLLAVAGLLTACSTPVPLGEAAPVESRTPGQASPVARPAGNAATGLPGAPGQGGAAAATPESRVATVDLARGADAAANAAAAAAAAAAAGRVVYFDYDSFEIKEQFRPILEAYAKLLITQRGKRMAIEGHADDRGSREYNLALGQKRAEAVVRSLTLLGVGENQIEAVSFGEERPASDGRDDAAYAKNRRAELKDR